MVAGNAPGCDGASAAAELARFVARLLSRAAVPAAEVAAVLDESVASLQLAEAALRYTDSAAAASGPPHIAVLGPTQTGKSTVVNLLLGQPAAVVSPLAGFTVHPRGFATVPVTDVTPWISGLLPGWTRRAPQELERDDLRGYALTTVATGVAPNGSAALPPCVVWDTPDFDSLAARQYTAAVLELAALADLHLVVLSKEKYSDLAVWQFLALTAPLGRPLVLCINKLTPDAEPAIVQSLRQRLAGRGAGRADVPIIPLPYDAALAAPAAADAGEFRPPPAARALRAAASGQLRRLTREHRAVGTRALLRQHWDNWLAPVRAEHQAIAEWHTAVAASGQAFVNAYARDYLDHPQRYDAFRRATVELLKLLEIPKVGGAVARVRRVLTWPGRRLFAAGRAWWGDRRGVPGRFHSLGVEAGVLVDTIETLLTGLQRDVARRARSSAPGAAVWQGLDATLEAERSRLQDRFEAGIQAHHRFVEDEVRAAAQQLYRELQQQPARLAALRTARVTMDLGYMLLAVKTGGLSALDAVWAPAAFAVSSLLMEGVAGLEMARQQHRLKARQKTALEEQFVRGVWVPELTALTERTTAGSPPRISADELAAATAVLAAWEAGDA